MTDGTSRPDRPVLRRGAKVAILIVNGFSRVADQAADNEEEARRYPWIRLCLEQIAKHTKIPHSVHIWDNARLPEHDAIYAAYPELVVRRAKDGRDVKHGHALDRLFKRLGPRVEYVVTLDNDSFPVRNGWLQNLLGRLDAGASLAGVWRDEMQPKLTPFIHPSCIAARRQTLQELDISFAFHEGLDVGQRITNEVLARGGEVSRLRRSNRRNLHFLMGGLYGDLIFHQGAGSRKAVFWTSAGGRHEEAVREALRNAVFDDVGRLVDYLSGNSPDSVGAQLGLPAPINLGGRSILQRLTRRA